MALGENVKEALKLWAWIASGVAVLAVSVVLGRVVSWLWASITAQLVGSALAFVGLLTAYLRAKHPGDTFGSQLKQFGLRLVGKGGQDVRVVPAAGEIRMRGFAYAEVVLGDRTNLDLQEQINRLADYIRDHVMPNFKQLFTRLDKIASDLDQAKREATEKADEAYRKAKWDLDQALNGLEQSAALDLRWAIFGLYIATVGVAMSYAA